MNSQIDKLMDRTGWLLLQELQQDARLSYSELGKRVGLSSPAVAERMQRMEETGIITGYHVGVDPAKLGLPVQAIVHLANIGGQSCNRVAELAEEIPEVLECYRITGDDSIIVKVVASSVDHLTQIIDQLSRYGIPSTSIVRSATTKHLTLPQP